jgi:bacterioferritin (cytochrome b1)
MDVTLDEAETLEEALDGYRRDIIANLDGEPTLIQEHAINTAHTIGQALRASLEKHRALAVKPPGFARRKKTRL